MLRPTDVLGGKRRTLATLRYSCQKNRIAQDTLARYVRPMDIEIGQTDVYARWYAKLRDRRARFHIDARIRRLAMGHAGDARAVGKGVSELRIDLGPGYRVYFTRRGRTLVVLLAGGDKDSQRRDIATAQALAARIPARIEVTE